MHIPEYPFQKFVFSLCLCVVSVQCWDKLGIIGDAYVVQRIEVDEAWRSLTDGRWVAGILNWSISLKYIDEVKVLDFFCGTWLEPVDWKKCPLTHYWAFFCSEKVLWRQSLSESLKIRSAGSGSRAHLSYGAAPISGAVWVQVTTLFLPQGQVWLRDGAARNTLISKAGSTHDEWLGFVDRVSIVTYDPSKGSPAQLSQLPWQQSRHKSSALLQWTVVEGEHVPSANVHSHFVTLIHLLYMTPKWNEMKWCLQCKLQQMLECTSSWGKNICCVVYVEIQFPCFIPQT
jgi:hypothetical protein